MNAIEDAFLDSDFNWVTSLQRIWRDTPTHVLELQAGTVEAIMRDFKRLNRPQLDKSLGRVITGGAGSGKTHLIGELRRRVWATKGWFVFVDIVGITDFWKTVVLGFIVSLRQPMGENGLPQYEAVFKAVLRTIPEDAVRAVKLDSEDLGSGAAATVNLFIKLLQSAYANHDAVNIDVIRALLLQRDPETANIAYAWLLGLDVSAEDQGKLKLTSSPPDPVSIVRSISWLMSLCGPTMIAIDQIDAIVTASNIVIASNAHVESETEAKARAIIETFGGGLMDLREQTARAITVLSCLGETWTILETKVLKSASDRFLLPPFMLGTDDLNADNVSALIERRLNIAYQENNVVPASRIWPFNRAFCEEASRKRPRQILQLCEQFRQACLRRGIVTEWPSEDTKPLTPIAPLRERLNAEIDSANIEKIKIGNYEGDELGALLRDVLRIYLSQFEISDGIDAVIVEPDEKKPVLHARLTFVFRDQGDLEKHFCFRVLGQTHHTAFLSRMKAAMLASGLDRDLRFRNLFVLRNDPEPGGPACAALVKTFKKAGGLIVSLGENDLRTFAAVKAMASARLPGFDSWLKETKPLCETTFFTTVGLCPPPVTITAPPLKIDDAPCPEIDPPIISPLAPTTIPLGPRQQGGTLGPVESLPIPLLTRHTALFAGSGSGKTVLLRRIVEEAALAGIPAIVLDTNNDLARLGVGWPERPAAFSDEDAAKAARYARDVEVVVWTPGVAAGRPLTLAVLPDFAALADNEEQGQAVDMAWATLAPLVGARGASKDLKEGVLKEALAAFARERRTGIDAFIEFLADLPDGVSKQTRAQKFGVEMSDQLRAKIAVNPLLNAPGQPLDPATLFAAEQPGVTRISVINFAGLEADASRQDFVNQLQMALFTHIKRHPSATPRLYVCDEAQNFAPSQASTASKASAVALARQGRKFGLGMIFATQAPKGIDTNIVSNCVTHFYGRMSSPALIDATEEMMASRGRAAKDLGALTAGTFYFSTEGTPQPVKLKTPLCLSWHPQNPATPEEVVALARRGG